MSSEVKCGKLCTIATIFGKKCGCNFKKVMIFIEVKVQMVSNIEKYVPGLQTKSEDK